VFSKDGDAAESDDEVEESTLMAPPLLSEDEYPESDISDGGNESAVDEDEPDESDRSDSEDEVDEDEVDGEDDSDAGRGDQEAGDGDSIYSSDGPDGDREGADTEGNNYYNPSAGEDIYGRPIEGPGAAAADGGKYVPPARRAALASSAAAEKLRESVVDEVRCERCEYKCRRMFKNLICTEIRKVHFVKKINERPVK
jgi:hypothetical protein